MNNINVPAFCWKLVFSNGKPIVAVIMPNIENLELNWKAKAFQSRQAIIEQETGLKF